MSYIKVTENVYAITDGSTVGNVCAFELPTQLLFVDSGMNPKIVESFRSDLEKQTGKKTTTLIITHKHADHFFGNQAFKDCRIISHRDTKQRMIEEKERWTEERLNELKKNAVDSSVYDGFEIIIPKETFETKLAIEDFDIKILVKNTGGHTAGSSFVYYPKAKAIACGDNFFEGVFPWAGDETADPEAWIAAIKEYLALDVEFVIPGHGKVCSKVELQKWLDYLEKAVILIRKMNTQGFSEKDIIKKLNELEYYPPKNEQYKELSLKRWYQVITGRS
ncbi:MAG: MBL fold metallo-hydrolase [Candidatus Heimdallarchaeota archaeon]|nr:MBL fold metallo-hydrolase [Candidatus Heimdallarchaeota archaeon]